MRIGVRYDCKEKDRTMSLAKMGEHTLSLAGAATSILPMIDFVMDNIVCVKWKQKHAAKDIIFC